MIRWFSRQSSGSSILPYDAPLILVGLLTRKIGKFIALVSPIPAVGVAALMLLAFGYGYQSGTCMDDPASPGEERCTYESGMVSAFRNALETGDYALFFWAGFVVVVCLIAALSALVGRAAPVWVCAVALYVLAVVGLISFIGLFIFPLAVALFISAGLLSASRLESHEA